MTCYIYLIHEREFKNQNLNIYRIGRSNKLLKFNQYPKGSTILIQQYCYDKLIETKLIADFSIKYCHRKDIGNKYFQGDFANMIKDISNKIDYSNKSTPCLTPSQTCDGPSSYFANMDKSKNVISIKDYIFNKSDNEIREYRERLFF